MTPLLVRALMRGPIALPKAHDVHLDALLAWVWMLRHHPERIDTLGRDATAADLIRPHLPLATIDLGTHRVPLATAWMIPDDGELGQVMWTRRKDGEDMAQRVRGLSASSPERPQLNRADVVRAPVVQWRAWGSRREVKKALKIVRQVGGLRSHGYGEVASWEVSEGDHDPVSTWVADGVAQRNLPVEALDTSELCDRPLQRVAVDPPYWPRCQQVDGVRPGSTAALLPQTADRLRAVAR